jgi:hypothetical protein
MTPGEKAVVGAVDDLFLGLGNVGFADQCGGVVALFTALAAAHALYDKENTIDEDEV